MNYDDNGVLNNELRIELRTDLKAELSMLSKP